MTDRYEPYEVTYADIAVINLGDGRIAAGCQLSLRHKTEEGRTVHTAYHVLSLYYGPGTFKASSTRQALTKICCDVIKRAAPGTKLVILRGNTPHFHKRDYYENDIRLYTGLDVKVTRKQGIERIIPDLQLLANDAIVRESSVECAV